MSVPPKLNREVLLNTPKLLRREREDLYANYESQLANGLQALPPPPPPVTTSHPEVWNWRVGMEVFLEAMAAAAAAPGDVE